MSIRIPRETPVMALPNAMLFPSTVLPLYIFEEQYRAMLKHSLETDRMFSIALAKPGVDDVQTDSDFFQVAGLGMIRACVRHPDGTSHLILQGIARVRYTAFIQNEPFRIARVEPVSTALTADEEINLLASKLFQVCAHMKREGVEFPRQLERYLAESPDPEVIADMLASNFVTDPLRRQTLLEQPLLDQRLRILIRYLQEES